MMQSIAILTTFDNNTAAAGLVEAFDAGQNIVGHGAMISWAMRDVSWRLGLMVSRNVAGTLYCAKGSDRFYPWDESSSELLSDTIARRRPSDTGSAGSLATSIPRFFQRFSVGPGAGAGSGSHTGAR